MVTARVQQRSFLVRSKMIKPERWLRDNIWKRDRTGFFEVGDGSYVKLTYSSYYTPAGHNIHKKGIKPDVEVKDNTKTKADEQLNKALSILQKK